jgi:hypothetical protein
VCVRGSSVSRVTGYGFGGRHSIPVGEEFFVVRLTKPCVLLVALYPGVKRPEHESDHLSASSAEVKNTRRVTSMPPNFTFNFSLLTYFYCYYSNQFIFYVKYMGSNRGCSLPYFILRYVFKILCTVF